MQLGLQSGHLGSPTRGHCRDPLAPRTGVVTIRGDDQLDLTPVDTRTEVHVQAAAIRAGQKVGQEEILVVVVAAEVLHATGAQVVLD